MAERRFWLFTFLGYVWRGLDGLRKTVHLVLMLLVLAVFVSAALREPVSLPRSAALVLAPEGALVDQLEGDATARAWAEFLGAPVEQTLTRDLIDAMERAASDTRISALVLQLGGMTGAGMATLRDVGDAIERFRESGKPVIAVGDAFSQSQYYLAARADEVWMHPEGIIFLQGFGSYRTYYREALEKLKVDANVFRVGEYKSFVEPWIRDDMSEAARENNLRWLGGLWRTWQDDVSAARQLPAGAIERYVGELPGALEAVGGDFGALAVEVGLVDSLVSRPDADQRLIDIAGRDPEDDGWRGVHHRDYLDVVRVERPLAPRPRQVGVVVAAGDIVDGVRPPGTIGGDSTAALLRRAIYDDAVEAVVLRVNSGGGSAFASEIIAEQVRALREAGKPVVVSMGDVAASGGYWISMDADEILASPVTITGSIGIGAFFPTFQRGLDWLGVHVDGVGTTEWAGQLRPDRALSERASRVLQLVIENGYEEFITRVADARELTVQAVDDVAGGRVWLGSSALEHDLVDGFGDLEDAIDAAAQRAGLDDYGVRYIEREPSFRDVLLTQFTQGAVRLASVFGVDPGDAAALLGVGAAASGTQAGMPGAGPQLEAFAGRVRREISRLRAWNDPRGVYLHCFCDVVP